MLLRSIHHVLHINRSFAVLSLWQSLVRPLTQGQSQPPLSFSTLTHTHSLTHTKEHTHPHKHIFSILNVYDIEFFSGPPRPRSHLFLSIYETECSSHSRRPSLSLSFSGLDVVERVKAARLRRSTSHAQPSVQRVLGGRVQRVVLRERQHHCISLREETEELERGNYGVIVTSALFSCDLSKHFRNHYHLLPIRTWFECLSVSYWTDTETWCMWRGSRKSPFHFGFGPGSRSRTLFHFPLTLWRTFFDTFLDFKW